jgi:hypothetical protein
LSPLYLGRHDIRLGATLSRLPKIIAGDPRHTAMLGTKQSVLMGGSTSYSELRKAIPISGDWLRRVASNSVTARFSAQLGGQGSKEDFASAYMHFLDAEGSVIYKRSLPPITASDRRRKTAVLIESLDMTVPAKATSAEAVVEFHRQSGEQNNAYAGNLSLVLSDYGAGH